MEIKIKNKKVWMRIIIIPIVVLPLIATTSCSINKKRMKSNLLNSITTQADQNLAIKFKKTLYSDGYKWVNKTLIIKMEKTKNGDYVFMKNAFKKTPKEFNFLSFLRGTSKYKKINIGGKEISKNEIERVILATWNKKNKLLAMAMNNKSSSRDIYEYGSYILKSEL